MENASFTTNPRSLEELLKEAGNGKLQLPDFQRSWVWDEQRIIDLLTSISRAFPIGAIMTLKTGGDVNFHPRPVQGVEESTQYPPDELLLDGQQRITSLYQVAMRGGVVETTTVKHKKIKRWFYVDIKKAIDPNMESSDVIFTVPENKKMKENAAWPEGLDLSSETQEFKNLMFPVCELFSWSDWQNQLNSYLSNMDNYGEYWAKFIKPFYENFIKVIEKYQVPVISLGRATSKEAVCTVFEKVNTGGKALDAFELVTAMYAAEGHKLRDDWYGDGKELEGYAAKIMALNSIGANKAGVLSKVTNTDFLQAIALFHTRDLRRGAIGQGKTGKELPQVTGKRQALLDLPLDAYLKYRDLAFTGFERASKFLHMINIFRVKDLPYQTQVIPLSVILADIDTDWENSAVREKLMQWYWCGVFGELYGSAVDTRIGADFMEVSAWFKEGNVPRTITDANFHKDRLKTMRVRLSAAYKGVNALLMTHGAKDFRSGQEFGHTAFFDEAADIHHIFPQKWCKENGKDQKEFDSIINKTPLTARTNRIIGGAAPSEYLSKLEEGSADFESVLCDDLDKYILTHLANPGFMRKDKYENFMLDRQAALLKLIERAMKKNIIVEGDDVDSWGEEED